MKLYLDYKKLFNTILIFFILLMPFGVFPPLQRIVGETISYAETAEEIKNKINQKNLDIVKLEEQIKTYQNELDVLGKQKNSLSVSLKQLDLTKKKLMTDISVTQNKIDKTNLKIQGLSSDIGDKEGAIKDHKDSIALELQKTNEFEHENILETMLGSGDFTAIWNDIDNIATVR